MPTHKHACQRCDHTWDCLTEKCYMVTLKPTAAVGPMCALCAHLIMAKRHAAARALTAAGFIAMVGDLTDME